jgi:hypothetical protein
MSTAHTELTTIIGVTIRATIEGEGDDRQITFAEVLNPHGVTVGLVQTARRDGSAWMWSVLRGWEREEQPGIHDAVTSVVQQAERCHLWQAKTWPDTYGHQPKDTGHGVQAALTFPPKATSYTRGIYHLAEAAGLRPQWRRAYRGVCTLALNGEGTDTVFGAVQVGARSGRVLRGQFIHGNGGPVENASGAVAVRRALAAVARP